MDEFKRRRRRAFILAAAGLAGIILLFTVKPRRTEIFRLEGAVWSTEYHITYRGDRNLSDSVAATLRRVELSVSPFNKASLITAVNENRTDSLDSYLLTLYRNSARVNRETGGAFDPTVAPLINAWGFGYKDSPKPDSAAVDSLLRFVGIGKTRVAGNRLVKSDRRTTLNFSAIAKGLGCDEVGRMLERNGVKDYLVEIGGEIAMRGLNGNGKKWGVSIDKPVASNDSATHESAEIIYATDCGIATSGNYRNYETDENGNRYSHIIDPSTGYPSRSDLLSATVAAGDCMTADAYATAFMVMGFERSRRFALNHPELAVMLIAGDNVGGYRIWSSPNFQRLRNPASPQ